MAIISENDLTSLNDDTALMITEKAVGKLIYNIKSADQALETTITNDIIGTSNDQITDSTNTATYNFSLNGIKNYIDNLTGDVFGDTAGNGVYITSVQQQNGSIIATTASAITSYITSGTNKNSTSNLPTSNSAITAAINTLNSSYDATAGYYIQGISTTAGKITTVTAVQLSPNITTIAANGDDTQKINITIAGISPQNSIDLNKASSDTYGVVKLSTTPTLNSDNPITSGAVYTAMSNVEENVKHSLIDIKLNKNDWYGYDFYYSKDNSGWSTTTANMIVNLNANKEIDTFIEVTDTANPYAEDTDFNNSNFTLSGGGGGGGAVTNYYIAHWKILENADSSYITPTSSAILAIKPSSDIKSDDEKYYYYNCNQTFENGITLIISPKDDISWETWRDCGIRGIPNEGNETTIQFKADEKPSLTTTASILYFKTRGVNN